MQEIVSRSAMNERGTFLFYAAHPTLEPSETFNDYCRLHTEKAAVLGCYNGKNIFIFDIQDQRLDGIKEVTAAHEMLHVAYDRLSVAQQDNVHRLIDEAMSGQKNPEIQKKVDAYELDDPLDRYNELHSMLGTEAKNLPKDLELYYDQYFTNRLAIVSLFERYETVFNQLESQQQLLVERLNQLSDEITAASEGYTADFRTLQSDIATFNARAANGSFSSQTEFNAERQRLVARQSALNGSRESINVAIEEYRVKKQELDELNMTAKDLLRSIDSRSLPEVPTI